MGNAGAKNRAKNERVIRVTKADGKTLEFHAPVLVKDLLEIHQNCYVGAFREATQPLPPNYKLRFGRVYYLLPLVGSTSFQKHNDCTATRVKIVITKQQLQKLVARQTDLDEVILEGLKLDCMTPNPSGSRVNRGMDTIPEDVELVSG